MRSLLVLSLLVTLCSARASVEVEAVARGVNLWQLMAGGRPKNTPQSTLPKVTIPDGKEAVIRMVREFPYVSQYDDRGVPQTFQTAYLGTTLYIRTAPTPSGIIYSGRMEFANYVAKPQARMPQILQAISVFQGTAASGQIVKIPVVTPRGKKTTLILRLTAIDSTGQPVQPAARPETKRT